MCRWGTMFRCVNVLLLSILLLEHFYLEAWVAATSGDILEGASSIKRTSQLVEFVRRPQKHWNSKPNSPQWTRPVWRVSNVIALHSLPSPVEKISSKLNYYFFGYLDPTNVYFITKITNFQGDLSDVAAKTASLSASRFLERRIVISEVFFKIKLFIFLDTFILKIFF